MALRLSRDVVAIARSLGHTSAELEEGPAGKYRVSCNCGYRCTWRRSQHDAMEALAIHLAKVTAARVRNGVSAPRQAV